MTIDPVDLLHPVEHAIASRWLGVEPPACARGIGPVAEAREPSDEEAPEARGR